MLEIINAASPTDIEILARLNQHVICGDYEGDRGLFWVISGDPNRDWDIIGCISERYRQQSMHTKEELGSAIIESVDIGFWSDCRKEKEETEDM